MALTLTTSTTVHIAANHDLEESDPITFTAHSRFALLAIAHAAEMASLVYARTGEKVKAIKMLRAVEKVWEEELSHSGTNGSVRPGIGLRNAKLLTEQGVPQELWDELGYGSAE
jgi:hypothetical protein